MYLTASDVVIAGRSQVWLHSRAKSDAHPSRFPQGNCEQLPYTPDVATNG